MIVYRWTWLIKYTRMEDAVKAAKEGCEGFWKPEKVAYRIYSSDVSPGDTLVVEVEGKDEAQFTEHWKRLDQWSATPSGKDFWKHLNDTIERHVSAERWNLVG